MKVQTDLLENFVASLDDFADWDSKKQTDYLAYFLINQSGYISVTAVDIQKSFEIVNIKPYSRISAYLSENSKHKKGKYIKAKTGYKLERKANEIIKNIVRSEPVRIQVSSELAKLLEKIDDTQERSFLEESLSCLRISAFRATIILTWILGVNHFQKYILDQKINDFNIALERDKDKRVKIHKIINYDDFSDLPETKLIELSRTSKIITNDVAKIMIEKLGTRNSAAHPSSVVFTEHKTTEFILDIVNNILLKY